MLAEKVKKHDAHVWLVNTGWSGGKFGEGKRMKLSVTRTILDRIHDGTLEQAEYELMPGFNLHVPKKCEGVDSNILMPINTWENPDAYKEELKKLASKFIKNFEKYMDGTP